MNDDIKYMRKIMTGIPSKLPLLFSLNCFNLVPFWLQCMCILVEIGKREYDDSDVKNVVNATWG